MTEVFYLCTDDSDKGVGAVVLQNVKSCKMHIAFASRKLPDHEVNYAIIEKECLSVVWA